MKITFDPTQGLIVIPTRLHGLHTDTIVRLALDTGATGSMINWDVAVLLGYDPASAKERIQVTTGSGIEFTPRIVVKKVEILSQTRSWLWLYLVAIMDWASRYVLSWELSTTLEIDFCIRALEKALSLTFPEIFNSDQGSQMEIDSQMPWTYHYRQRGEGS